MKHFSSLMLGCFLCAVQLCTPSPAASQVSVLTQHNDTSRTGQNLAETLLTTANVRVSGFGKLFSRAVDGQIYAQPLYVPGLTIRGSVRNVVYAATEHNSVYAFDADDPNATQPLWQVNMGPSVPTNDVCLVTPDPACPNMDAFPEYGITSTPVIDAASNTIYLVAKTKDSSNASYHYKLHALDLLSGAEKFGGPVEISARVQGTGVDNVNGTVSFDPVHQGNRPGLLLLNGIVYMAFASVGEIPPWHGWVLGYNAATLQQVTVYNSTPDGAFGGIWGGGKGLLTVAGDLYVMTGNGTFDANRSGRDYGDSFIRLTTSGGLAAADYFTPYNQSYLDSVDLDLGSGAPMALPGTGLIAGAGKDGILRLVNTANMGQYHASSNSDVQEFPFSSGIFMGGPIYWNSPNNGPVIYLWGSGDYLKAYKFSGTSFQSTPVSQNGTQGTAGYSNSVPLSLSANGSQAGTGIIWASAPLSGDANLNTVPGILRAFDASDLSQEIWNSQQNAARDGVGNYAKFSAPTIANGKVYLASFSGQLLVYGLNPPPAAPLPVPWSGQDIGSVGVAGSASYLSGTFTVSGSGADIEDAADAFQYVSQPLTGDGQIIARVASQQNTDPWAKAGVMIRETLTPGSTQAMMVVTPGNGAAFQRRLTTGGLTVHTPGPAVTAPYWVKMVRSGTTFSGSVSADGVNWVPVGSDTINMASSVYLGLAVTSHNNAVSCQVTMDGVSASGSASASPAVSIGSPLNGAYFTAPATIPITATATPSAGALVSRVDFYAGATLIASRSASPYAISWNAVPAGSYSLTAQVTDSLGKTATSTAVGIAVLGALPSAWTGKDIGSVGVPGSAGYAGGTFTVIGSGADIEDQADAFQYVYQPLNGDGQIVARVASQQNTDPWAKAGVMIRETITAGSKQAMMVVTPGNGVAFQRRLTTAGSTTSTSGPAVAAPYWVKVVRSGTTFSGSVSADGVTWVPVGSATISMASSVYIGLAVTSHNNAVSCTATMDGVGVTGVINSTPTVSISSPLDGTSFTAPATVPITAVATASTGATVSRVDFFSGSTPIGTSSSAPYGITWSNVPAGSYSLTAQVTDSLGKSTTSTPIGITVGSLPSPWLTRDLGSVGVAGSASYANGTFTVKGSGADIEDNADAFRYVYHSLTGNGQIVARVVTQQNTDPWAKAGVMIRDTLTAGSKQAMMVVTPGNGAAFQRRLATGGITYHTPGPAVTAPYWVRIVRSGSTFSGSVSADGVVWAPVGSATISMATSVYIGLAVTSHNNALSCTVTMDGVK